MMRVSTRLGFIVLLVFPIIAGSLLLMLRVMARRYAAAQEQQLLLSAKAHESFSGIRVVKATRSKTASSAPTTPSTARTGDARSPWPAWRVRSGRR
ncbi:MAG: hypothetical protein ACT4TC_07615 [Myxococcaceae bacterium]